MPPRAGVHGFSAAALRRTMTRAGVSTDELAELIGVARQTVSAWLNNVTVPSPGGSLAKVADVLEVEVAEFTPSAVGDPSLVDLRVRAGLSQTAAAVALGGFTHRARGLSNAVSVGSCRLLWRTGWPRSTHLRQPMCMRPGRSPSQLAGRCSKRELRHAVGASERRNFLGELGWV